REVAPPSGSSRRAWLVLAALFLCLVVPTLAGVYLSTRPVMRLRTAPPADFADSNPTWNAKRRAAEQQLARAYWDSAVQGVESIYHYGSDLPDTPPAAFKVDTDALVGTTLKIDAAATRARYWQKLHQAWSKPQAWEESDGWHTDWLDSLSTSLQEGLIKLQWKLTSWLPG
ncbi:MAG TPA: hypothetical protein VKU44_10465, partial [Terriglobia bacterium]|nr:hypothetical protein [Terriglobia bacterium]